MYVKLGRKLMNKDKVVTIITEDDSLILVF